MVAEHGNELPDSETPGEHLRVTTPTSSATTSGCTMDGDMPFTAHVMQDSAGTDFSVRVSAISTPLSSCARPVHSGEEAAEDLTMMAPEIQLDVCMDGTCRGVVDTGTSHLGVPAPWDKEVEKRLKREAGDLLDCRNAEAPEIEIELHEGKVITLYPFNYMRRLPLREGVSVGSSGGVQLKQAATPSSESVVLLQGDGMAAAPSPPVSAQGNNSELPVERHCSPRLMAVKLPEPLGPKLFILGEPVLHRYYTVYDWEQTKVGFALANSRQNSLDPTALRGQKGELPKEVDMLLMQQQMKVTRSKVVDGDLEEETLFLQVQVHVTLKPM
ncbi:PGC [Symbiodinium sp. CCMP2592]|nr:PGC [Symbiodinium sp. CCMP2592]